MATVHGIDWGPHPAVPVTSFRKKIPASPEEFQEFQLQSTQRPVKLALVWWLFWWSFLVGGWATPLKNMSSSIGMIRNPTYGKIKNVPNHQPVFVDPPAKIQTTSMSAWWFLATLWKIYEFVIWMIRNPIYFAKIKLMFQTTNQIWYPIIQL